MKRLSPLQQAKLNVLKIIASSRPEVGAIIFPCLARDHKNYEAALALPEVKIPKTAINDFTNNQERQTANQIYSSSIEYSD